MAAIPKPKMTSDEFLAWAAKIPKEAGTFELHDGAVVLRHGPATSQQAERAEHWEVKFALGVALREAIRKAGLPCFAAVDGPSVRVSRHKTYKPDALVYCGGKAARGALEIANPVLIAEVLSPGTERLDLGEKVESYFSLPSLHHYLIVDPERPLVLHHRRTADGALETRIVRETRLRLDPPGIEADLSEILEAGRTEETDTGGT